MCAIIQVDEVCIINVPITVWLSGNEFPLKPEIVGSFCDLA